MSSEYTNFALREFKLIDLDEDVKDCVLKCLNIIAKEGHSGGSMGVFTGIMRNWVNNSFNPEHLPFDLTVDSSTSELYLLIKELDVSKRVLAGNTLISLMNFIPLSDVTGNDNEWVLVSGNDNDKLYQNNRMFSIFKDSDGKAYWLDGTIFYEPTEDMSTFIGFTNIDSREYIKFPFDPKTKSKEVYYTSSTRDSIIKGDPYEWLSKQAV